MFKHPDNQNLTNMIIYIIIVAFESKILCEVIKMLYTASFSKLIDMFRKMPGVGSKSAVRMAYHVVGMSDEEVLTEVDNMLAFREKFKFDGAFV